MDKTRCDASFNNSLLAFTFLRYLYKASLNSSLNFEPWLELWLLLLLLLFSSGELSKGEVRRYVFRILGVEKLSSRMQLYFNSRAQSAFSHLAVAIFIPSPRYETSGPALAVRAKIE